MEDLYMSDGLSLSHDNEAFIQQQVAVGAFRDRTDAIEAGVEMLRKRQALIERLDEGRRQLDQGEYVEFDEKGLHDFFESLKERARSVEGH
jgi:Arc/MetJ-type ribon-helix-helix transcriptional regulator